MSERTANEWQVSVDDLSVNDLRTHVYETAMYFAREWIAAGKTVMVQGRMITPWWPVEVAYPPDGDTNEVPLRGPQNQGGTR